MNRCNCGNPEVIVTSKGLRYEIHCEDCNYTTGTLDSFNEAIRIWNERNKEVCLSEEKAKHF
ncbi:MAG: Lar family restriction alleviation protein [Cloacibacillus sp.]